MIELAHHWLVTDRGGERVLREMVRLFPQRTIHTLVYRPDAFHEWLEPEQVRVSPLQRIPFATRYWRTMLPLHPWAFQQLLVSKGTRLLLSSDAAVTKGLSIPEGIPHVCYCHSPPRYLWDMAEDYSQNASQLGWLGRRIFNWTVPPVRRFDQIGARRVDHFIANSRFVRARIQKHYGRDAAVIYPPINVHDFDPQMAAEDFYLLVTQLVPYKRADIAVRAFTTMNKRLVVIGEGSELRALQHIAGPSVTLLGRQPFNVVKRHFETCRAFLYPQIEDFGITAVEAQAAGRPIIAYRAGGALETVVDGRTGIFFDEQRPESLMAAVQRFEREFNYDPLVCRQNAERFTAERFRNEIKAFLLANYPALFANYPWPD